MTIAVSTEGLHPTTESCLEALQWLQETKECRNVLDMGCGNGILSVVAASIWDAKVLAADISDKAVEDTRQMAAANGLGDVISVIRSDGIDNHLIKNNSPYDLICFNLLAEPIIKSAPLIKALLAKDGICIISGILRWESEAVINTFKELNIEIYKELSNTPWCTYLLCHKTETGIF
jgi:ribosomal protein L11 methyltransferase